MQGVESVGEVEEDRNVLRDNVEEVCGGAWTSGGTKADMLYCRLFFFVTMVWCGDLSGI